MRSPILLLLCIYSFASTGQNSIKEILKNYNTEQIPYISAQDLAILETNAILLDARELKEYKVSHIQNAIYVGYDNFDIELVKTKVKDNSKTIVVYCSLGIRSEDIAEQLKKAGYTSIFNLFGGIFEWKNNNFPVFDSENKETDKVHAYSKEWGQWLLKGTKIYD